jgi:hypothetical protein
MSGLAFDGGLEVVVGISKTRHSYPNDTKLYHSIGVLPSIFPARPFTVKGGNTGRDLSLSLVGGLDR